MEGEANIGLVLTGGGARSAYQAGCILAITEIATSMGIRRPFPVITGMSAGSINAGFMAGRADKPLQGAKDLVNMGARLIEVNLQGPGSGRDSVVRALQSSGLAVTVLRDVTPLPHNGCRPPKKRRV